MSKKNEDIDYEEYESLKQSKFKQQKLPGWRSTPSMFNSILFFFSLGILAIGIGLTIKIFSDEIITQEIVYNNETNVFFKLKKTMKGDIMVYYKVLNFYQNNRRFMNSRSEDQLKGINITLDEMKNRHECDPIITNRDLRINISSTKYNLDDVAIPCGLIARSFVLFDDTFDFSLSNGTKIIINDTNIARKYDRENYKNSSDSNKQWLNIEDEHFLVWMRTSPFVNFTKLYGRIKGDLQAGTEINVTITHNDYYNEGEYQHSNIGKNIYLTTVNSFGGKNDELALSYGIFGILCIILGIVFIFGFNYYNKRDK